MSGDVVVAVLDVVAARALTDRLRGTLHLGHKLLLAAWQGQAHIALGYAGADGWSRYCTEEFTEARMLRIDPESRRKIAAPMREAGMSHRAIASGFGVDEKTVRNDLRPGAESSAPAAPPGDPAPAPQTTTGTDGKTYQRPAPGTHASPKVAAAGAAWAAAVAEGRTDLEPARKRRPLPDVALHLGGDVQKLTGRLERLAGDDRLPRNRDVVRSRLLRDLHQQRDALNALIAALDEGTTR